MNMEVSSLNCPTRLASSRLDYDAFFDSALDKLRDERRYRVFADLERVNEPDCEFMTTVIFACPKCGLAHEVTQVQVPKKKSGRFDCVDCGATFHSWYG